VQEVSLQEMSLDELERIAEDKMVLDRVSGSSSSESLDSDDQNDEDSTDEDEDKDKDSKKKPSKPSPPPQVQPKPPTEKEILAQKFKQFYMQKITEEFADDLDKIRESDDFDGKASMDSLIWGLGLGVQGWGEGDMRRVVG